jgi:cell division protein FtsQ
MRRFESAIGRLPGLKTQNRRNDARGLPGGPGGIGRALLGLALLLGLVAGFAYLHADDRWFVYREDVEIGGLTYLDADAIYAASGVDNWHRLWLRSAVIRQRLLDQPFVADASVSLSWPNHVTIQIVEQEPVALWVTSEATWWLMPNGEALPVHDDRFNHLPQIIDPQREARAVFSANRPAIMPHVLTGALALWANLPGIEQLRFNHDYGLNFSLPGLLTWVYWGDGQESERKFAQLAAVQQMIERGEARPQIIDLRFERAYFR